MDTYLAKVRCFYNYPDQFISLAEMLKNELDYMRRHASSARVERAVVRVQLTRGYTVG